MFGVVVVNIYLGLSNLWTKIGDMLDVLQRTAGLRQGQKHLPQQNVQFHLVERTPLGIHLIGPADEFAQPVGGRVVGMDAVLKTQGVIV